MGGVLSASINTANDVVLSGGESVSLFAPAMSHSFSCDILNITDSAGKRHGVSETGAGGALEPRSE
ncbi:hypothetical protein ADG881_1980 [Alcanivorax sp. DG881]|nr:hypothetical protein ADG881_1980 [Alcanivorax sp. DG881]